MPSWDLTLVDHKGKYITTHHQNVSSSTDHTTFIEGRTSNAHTWHFSKYEDETQSKSDWVCQFGKCFPTLAAFAAPPHTILTVFLRAEFQAGALRFSSDLDDTFIQTMPQSPACQLTSRTKLPYSDDSRHYFILLRNGDTIDFVNKSARIRVNFDPTATGPDVEVESSGPGPAAIKIKDEQDADAETDDETVSSPAKPRFKTEAEESQHVYSTSRENQSPTPRPAIRDSQIIKDTPNRQRFRSQHASTVPESLPLENPQFDQPGPAFTSDTQDRPLSDLPDVNTGDLPDTSPNNHANFFELHGNGAESPCRTMNSSIGHEVDRVVENLNESNPPSKAPTPENASGKDHRSTVPPKGYRLSTELSTDVLNPPARSSQDVTKDETTVCKKSADIAQADVDLVRETPADGAVDVRMDGTATRTAEHSSHEVIDVGVEDDVIHEVNDESHEPDVAPANDETHGDNGPDEHEVTIVVADAPTPIATDQKQATGSAKNKRKKVKDVGSAAHASKRAKFADDLEQDEQNFASATPASTASRRTSSGRKDADKSTPSASAPRRSSIRRKSLDNDIPPSTVSRRVSERHRSTESEHASPIPVSPSLQGRRYAGPPPRILFSNTKIIERDALMKFLKKHNAQPAELATAKGSNFLCVGTGELLKTPKLLHSLTQGKTIVTDDWITRSSKVGFLLDPSDFLPKELHDTMHQDRSQLLSGQIIYVTPALRKIYNKGWDDVQAIIRQAGATDPLVGPLAAHDTDAITLYLGTEKDDAVAAELQEFDVTVYKKDILGASIVRGHLILDDETLELPQVDVVEKKTQPQAKSTRRGRRTKKN